MDEFFDSLENADLEMLDYVINYILSNDEIQTDEKEIQTDEKHNEINQVDNQSNTKIPYGCEHYLRRCKIVSPCCGKIYICRFCHDEENYNLKIDLDKKHKIDRFSIKEIICSNCETIQEVKQYCKNCKICFGMYFCNKCNFFDDIDKGQYHCDKCGFCRIGGKDNYIHCDKCNMCISIKMENHKCFDIQGALCSICMSELFTSTIQTIQMKCGHYIHKNCFCEMTNLSYKCPICFASIVETEEINKLLDNEIEHTPMPKEYENLEVDILCNDCHLENKVKFHIIGEKCPNCGGYNTRKI